MPPLFQKPLVPYYLARAFSKTLHSGKSDIRLSKNTLIDTIHRIWFCLQIHKSHFEDMADTDSTDGTLGGISDEEDQDKEASSKYFVALWTPLCWKSKKIRIMIMCLIHFYKSANIAESEEERNE